MSEPTVAKPSGFLLVIEGIDGAGKTTLRAALAAWCAAQGLEVVESREPTDGPHGRALRQSATGERLPIDRELELFLADRREHVDQVIAPALEAGKVVVLDRYYFSTAAYQGARGIDPMGIVATNEAFAPEPDLVLLLDLDPAEGRTRIGARGGTPDGFEGADYLAAVRNIFLGIDRPYFRRVSAAQPPSDVLKECIAHTIKGLIQRGLLPVRGPR